MSGALSDRSRRSLWAGLLLLGLATLALTGCTEVGSDPSSTIDREETIEPGSFVEVNLAMNDSAELAYRWSTTPERELAFDVHSHPDRGQVSYHDRYNATSGDDTFTAPSAGTYSLLWENPGEEQVTVTIRIEGNVELVSTSP